MEQKSDTLEDRKLLFSIIAIETGAKQLGITPSEMTRRLDAQGLIEGRLMKHYEMLHTQSQEYVADDIVKTLLNYESGE